MYQSKNSQFLVCECELNPIQFVKSSKTNKMKIKWNTNLDSQFGREKLKLREFNSRRIIEQTKLENHPIKIMKNGSFDLIPFISAKIEIEIKNLNSSKYHCCVEYTRPNKYKPYLCSTFVLKQIFSLSNSTQITSNISNQTAILNNSSKLKINEINRILGHFSKIIFARQLIILIIFFLVILIALYVWYKCFMHKKSKKDSQSPNMQIPDDNLKSQLGSLTEKQLKAFYQNAVINPKRLDFKNPTESPESAPPTYNEFVSENDAIKN